MTNIQCNLFIVLGVHFERNKEQYELEWGREEGLFWGGDFAGKVNVTDDNK